MTGSSDFTPLTALSAAVLDTETTGLDASRDRVVQIAALGLRGIEIEQAVRFESLVNPGVAIPAAASAIHGIYAADIEAAPAPDAVIQNLVRTIGKRVIIGHSISFDLEILAREAALASVAWPDFHALDTRPLAMAAGPALPDYSLDTICAWLEIEIEGRHTAMGDALATAKVYAALVPRLRDKGIRTLAEARTICRNIDAREAKMRGAVPTAPPPPGQLAGPDPAQIDSYVFSAKVADVMSQPPVIVPGDQAIDRTMALLLEKGISSVLVNDAQRGFGIATERDILRAIAAQREAAFGLAISQIMSSPLQSVRPEEPLYRAIGRIERLNIRHLAVRDRDGALVGIVTTRNLLRHRGSAAMVLGDEIEVATDEADLGAAWSRVPGVARALLDQDLGARTIAGNISSEIRALTRKAADLGAARMMAADRGPAPYPFALLVLGSAGRGESLIAADQDNAIVIDADEVEPAADAWFAELGEHIASILDAVGVVYCKGGVMAKNAEWRRSKAAWIAQIENWVARQNPTDLLNVDIFYDAATVSGDPWLGRDVLARAFELGSRSPSFLRALEMSISNWRPPISFLGNLRTGSDDRIDLKFHGLFPIVTASRVLAIKNNVLASSTADRLRGVAAKGAISDSVSARLERAHETILGAILNQQLIDAAHGQPPGPKVDLRHLDKPVVKALTNAVRHAGDAVEITREGMF